MVCHLVEIVVGTCDHFHAILVEEAGQAFLASLGFLVVGPQAEARQCRGDAWHAECHALERSVAPRFVVRGIDCEVEAKQEVVVVHIEYAVGTIEVARHKHYFYSCALTIGDAMAVERLCYHVASRFVEIVGDKRHRQWAVRSAALRGCSAQALFKVFARAGLPGGHFD